MSRTAVVVKDYSLPESGVTPSTDEVSIDTANGNSVDLSGNPCVEVRCVNNGTFRVTSTQNGDTWQLDTAMTAGQRKVFQYDPKVFAKHPSGADPRQLYVDQVAGASGDFKIAAWKPVFFA